MDFHYVDEAAPPALMRALAWKFCVGSYQSLGGQIFVLKFHSDLCLLLKASGCIAVSVDLK
jgi:hypothetical protein